MNILHYTIGLLPERSGGSVVYAGGLMRQQLKDGQNVMALVCGDTLFRAKKSSIKKCGVKDSLPLFKLVSPTTPTLIHGVRNPGSIYGKKQVDRRQIEQFIADNHIDIFHIHTFMGLPLEVLEIFKERQVRIVYTSHDFYGICLGYSMLLPSGKICDNPCAKQCAVCNANAPSEKFLRLANSSLYHFLKTKMGMRGKMKSKSGPKIEEETRMPLDDVISDYEKLRLYYQKMFRIVDMFHFNSAKTDELYRKYLGKDISGKTINIATPAIYDRRRMSVVNDEKIILGYVASIREYKGFPLLKKVLVNLYKEGVRNWELQVWGNPIVGTDEDCENIVYKGQYDYKDIVTVFREMNLLVVPSQWNETFGLTVLESMSFGVPAVVSSTVGAKDIVAEIDNSLIFCSESELYDILENILKNPKLLSGWNQKIMSNPWNHSISRHSQEIMKLYSSTIQSTLKSVL